MRSNLVTWSVVAAFIGLTSLPGVGRYIAAGFAGVVVYVLAEDYWRSHRTYRERRAADRRLRREAKRQQARDQHLLGVIAEVLDSQPPVAAR